MTTTRFMEMAQASEFITDAIEHLELSQRDKVQAAIAAILTFAAEFELIEHAKRDWAHGLKDLEARGRLRSGDSKV